MSTPAGFNYYQWGSSSLWTAGPSSRKQRGPGARPGRLLWGPPPRLLANSAQVAALQALGSRIPAGCAGTRPVFAQ